MATANITHHGRSSRPKVPDQIGQTQDKLRVMMATASSCPLALQKNNFRKLAHSTTPQGQNFRVVYAAVLLMLLEWSPLLRAETELEEKAGILHTLF